MIECKPMPTPMHPSMGFTKDESETSIDYTIYKGMIGLLLYLIVSKLDIMFSVCLYARFQSNPKEFHLKSVKRIFRYLAGFTNYSLFYEKHKNFRLVGFCDADYARDRVERKRKSGGCHFLGNCFIS
uniref:Retrovirus-related Pol polyprotein from transposon TNT 1-94 n=1 Tax=Cajanus cajan TaxID=3821 RepID=A0A151T4W6_CAJCA|nr:hypothetical protein KK1_016620 [Cajanus cajan]